MVLEIDRRSFLFRDTRLHSDNLLKGVVNHGEILFFVCPGFRDKLHVRFQRIPVALDAGFDIFA